MFFDDSARVGTYDPVYGYGIVGTQSWYTLVWSLGTVGTVGWVRWYGTVGTVGTVW